MIGLISGMPVAPAGTASFTLQVMDSLGATATAALSVTTDPAPVALAGGGSASDILSGPGATLGLVSGLPAPPAGTSAFTIQVADTAGGTGRRGLSVTTDMPYITAVTASSSSQAGYFTDTSGAGRLWVCTQPWALPTNAGRWSGNWQQDMDTFLAGRAAQGVSVVLVYPIGNLVNGGTHDNGNTWDNIAPFNTGQDPASGLNNTFWARIDYMMSSAVNQGIMPMVNIDLPYNTGTGQCFSGWGTTQYQAFGAALGTRYRNQPGLEWNFGDDAFPTTFDTFYDAFLTGRAGAGDTHRVSAQWMAEYTSRYATDTNANAAWGTAHSAYNFVYTYNAGYFCTEYAYGEVASRGASALLPVVRGNGYYYQGGSSYSSTADRAYRQETWWPLASGARGILAQSGSAASWSSSSIADVTTDWFFVNNLKNIITAFTSWPEWNKLLPDLSSAFVTAGRGTRVSGLVSGGSGTPYEPAFTNSWVAASITPDKTLAVLYLPNSTTVTCATGTLPSGWTASWIDPVTGAASSAGTGTTYNSTAKGANSQGDPDWVLVFRAAGPADAGPNYAGAEITGTGAGTWVNPDQVKGSPDSRYATWAVP